MRAAFARRWCGSRKEEGAGAETKGDEKVVVVGAPMESNDITCLDSFFFDEEAPILGGNVALVAIPIRLAKPPYLVGVVVLKI